MKKVIIVSDLNGEEVDESASATIRVTWEGREKQRELTVTAQEADDLFGTAGKEVARRGRKATTTTNGATAPAATADAPAPAATPAPAAPAATGGKRK